MESTLSMLQAQVKGLLNTSLSVSLELPDPVAMVAALRKQIDYLLAQINELLTVGITVKSPLPAQLAAIAASVARLQAQVTSTIAQIAAAAAKIAALLAQLTAINFQIDLALQLGPAFAAAGLDVYRYDGDAGSFGSTVQAALSGGLQGGGGPNLHVNAIILAARDGAAWSGLQVALKVA